MVQRRHVESYTHNKPTQTVGRIKLESYEQEQRERYDCMWLCFLCSTAATPPGLPLGHASPWDPGRTQRARAIRIYSTTQGVSLRALCWIYGSSDPIEPLILNVTPSRVGVAVWHASPRLALTCLRLWMLQRLGLFMPRQRPADKQDGA
jgi:hypothetical protein